jgi:Methyltransferase domain
MKTNNKSPKPDLKVDLVAQEIRPGQSLELLKELHILTREGKLNQDSRRKLKQVYHLYGFIEKLLLEIPASDKGLTLADHGAGKSYLGFIIYDLFFNAQENKTKRLGHVNDHIYGIETRAELVQKSRELAARLGFTGMSFLNLSVAESAQSEDLPPPNRHRHRLARLRHRHRRRHRLRPAKTRQIHGLSPLLPS